MTEAPAATSNRGELESVESDPLIKSVLRLPELHSVAEGLADVGLDALIDNAAVHAIPVVATVTGLVRGGIGFREAWLSRKLLSMLYGIGEATDEDVRCWRKRLRSEQGATETGERLLALIDRVTTTWKSQMLGELFRAYLDGRCDRRTFLNTAEMVDAALTEDLRFLVGGWHDGDDEDACGRLTSVGLMADRSSALVVEDSGPPVLSDQGTLVRDVMEKQASGHSGR